MKIVELAPGKTRIAYDDVGQGLPIVLLHAFPLDRTMWSYQVGPFTNAGYRVLALDLPGFGDSPIDSTPLSIDGAADIVANFLETLRIDRAAVVGISMGGYVAMSIARRHPNLLAALILADTRAAADVPHVRANRDKLMAAVRVRGPVAAADAMLNNLVSEPTRSTNPELIVHIRQMILQQSPDGLIAGLTALRDRPDAAPFLDAIKAPTLVLVGEFDTVTPLLTAARIAGNVHRSDLAHIPGAGHLSNLENPDAFNNTAIAFLKKHK